VGTFKLGLVVTCQVNGSSPFNVPDMFPPVSRGPCPQCQMPPALSPARPPSVSSAKTSSLPSEDVGLDPEALLSADKCMASDSPDSPDEIKASSHARK